MTSLQSEGLEGLNPLVEAAFEGVTVTADGVVLEANEALGRMLGCPAAELRGAPTTRLWTPESERIVAQKRRERCEEAWQVVGVRRCGERFPMEVVCRPTRHRGRRAWITGVRDLTGRLRDEDERQRTASQVQHAQKLESLGVLAGGIAHDFNNLLQGIMGNAELARMAAARGGAVEPYLERIERIARRAGELTDQMLAYAGRSQRSVERVELGALIEGMRELLGVSVSKQVCLQLDLSGAAGPVEADPAQLRQVLLSLVSNASEAIGDRPGWVRVRTRRARLSAQQLSELPLLSAPAPGDFVELEVADDGEGMDAETAARIFEPFFTTRFTGRGLGMAAVLGIVQSHRGAVLVESAPGAGTAVRVLLPAAGQRALPVDPRAATGGGPLVLVADDEPVVREVVRAMLEREGCEVLVTADGREAVERFREERERIQLVLLDVSMPNLSGAQALAALRALDPEVPVILSSGYTEVDALEGVKDTIAGFVHKPFSGEQLLAAVRQVLDL